MATLTLAVRNVAGFPRWIVGFGLVTAALQVFNMTTLFTGLGDSATMIGNVAFGVWLGTCSVGLARIASNRATSAAAVAA